MEKMISILVKIIRLIGKIIRLVRKIIRLIVIRKSVASTLKPVRRPSIPHGKHVTSRRSIHAPHSVKPQITKSVSRLSRLVTQCAT
jgi:hypothetical protein